METIRPAVFRTGVVIVNLLGLCSLALPLVITLIAVLRLSTANHGRPIFAWAVEFYLVGVLLGLASLSGIVKIKRYALLWLPAVGLAVSGALALLAFLFWLLSGLNIQ